MAIVLSLASLLMASPETVKLLDYDFAIRGVSKDCEVSRRLAVALSRAQGSFQLQGFGLKLLACPGPTKDEITASLVDRTGQEIAAERRRTKHLNDVLVRSGFRAGTSAGQFALE